MCQSDKLSAQFNTFNIPYVGIYERMDNADAI